MSSLKKRIKHVFSWKRLFDYPLPRFIFGGVLGFRHPGNNKDKNFEHFFQYKLGHYQTGYCLYFEKEPSLMAYKNEIWDKMREYSGIQLIEYLEFHYNACENKKGFLRFMRYEQYPLTNVKLPHRYRMRHDAILTWVAEQEKILLQTTPETGFAPDPADNPALTAQQFSAIFNDPAVRAAITDSLENAIPPLIRTYSGKIKPTHPQYIERLIMVFSILQNLRSPEKKGGPLFENFHNTDMVAILRQFEAFSDKKANTIQIKISEINAHLNYNDPKVDRLMKALQDFFFGPHSSPNG